MLMPDIAATSLFFFHFHDAAAYAMFAAIDILRRRCYVIFFSRHARLSADYAPSYNAMIIFICAIDAFAFDMIYAFEIHALCCF